jgi:hypothetical protein
MRFYSSEECSTWLAQFSRAKPDEDKGLEKVGFSYPKEPYGIFVTAHWFAHSFMYRSPVLLWITEWGIWPPSENWHLYYKLRQAAGDFQLLHEAPGHLFLEHEIEDLASFVQVAMLNGWGGYILTQADYVNAFFSHDEYIDFFARFPENLEEVRKFWTSPSAKT